LEPRRENGGRGERPDVRARSGPEDAGGGGAVPAEPGALEPASLGSFEKALESGVVPLVAPSADDPRLGATRLVALDVDGVLTDGRISYGESGPRDERPSFHVQDGIAIRWLLAEGVAVVWISGRGAPAVAHRARELGVAEYLERVPSKSLALRSVQERLGIEKAETVAMGDDLPDLGLRAAAGFFAAPANAVIEVRARADLVTRAGGGAGAVRELAEAILRAKGRWQALVDAAER